MADKLTPEEQKELNSLLKERERVEKQISVNVEKAANARHMEKKRLDELIKKGDEESKQLEQKINKLQKQESAYNDITSFVKSIKISEEATKKIITEKGNKTNLLASVTERIVGLRENEISLEGDALKASQEKRAIFESLAKDVANQAKQMVSHHDKENKFEKERKKLLEEIKDFEQEEKDEALKLLQIKQNLVKQEERLHELQHAIQHFAGHLPEGMVNAYKGAVGLAKSIGKAGMAMGPLVLLVAVLGAGLHAFMELDQAGEDFRKETGMTVANSKELEKTAHHIAVEFRGMGVGMKEAYDTMTQLANESSDMFHYSEATVGALSLLNTRMGIAASDSAKVATMFEQVGKLSEGASASVTVQAAKMAAEVGVSAKEVFQDMAKNAGVLSKHLRGNVNLFVQQAVKAKMLGTSLEDVAKTAENLLDFEKSIEEELVAATFVGGQFNLSRARALAYEGKIADANEEILNQIQASGDFREKDYFTQTQLAKAAGKTVEEINKELGVRDKLASLGGDTLKNANTLIDKGVDISKLSEDEIKKQAENLANQQKIQGTVSSINDLIAGMIEKVGGNLTPAFQLVGDILVFILSIIGKLGEGLNFMKENMGAMIVGTTVFLGLMGLLLAAKVKQLFLTRQNTKATTQEAGAEAGKATAGIFGSLAKIPFGVGLALAGGIVLGMMALMSSFGKKGDDVYDPGYGDRVLMGPEGAIQLNNKDSVLAGTDLFKPSKQQSQPVSPIASSNNNMIGALIQEFRGVRADMQAGKIGVYMDGDRVTAGVAKVVGRGTRNDFALQ